MNRILLYICITVLSVNAASAQELKLKLGVNTGMPTGDFKNFMGKNSFRGFHGELFYPISERFNIGLGVSSQDYYEKLPRQIYETKDGTISAVVSNSIQTMPILVKANYNLTKESLITPYIGIGAGFNLIRYAQYLGEFGEQQSYFKPAIAADAGINVPFNKVTRAAGINLGANYNYMPFNNNGINNLNNWGVHLGVYFPLR